MGQPQSCSLQGFTGPLSDILATAAFCPLFVIQISSQIAESSLGEGNWRSLDRRATPHPNPARTWPDWDG